MLSLKRAAALSAGIAMGLSLLGANAAHSDSLTGAGSTFVAPIMTQWAAAYKKATGVDINYQAIGSGGGISALIGHTVDFAGSDAPMNAQEMAEAKAPVIHLPDVIGTECLSYNIPGIRNGVRFTPAAIAGIYLGTIKYWDDPAITRVNPGVKFPHHAIFVAHRSDGSGTTFIFTSYLSAVSPAWKARVGAGKSVSWPVGLGGKGNEGVSGLLTTHPYSIGYIELAYAVQNDIPYGPVENAKGKWIYPSAKVGSIAAEGVKMPADLRAVFVNTPNAAGYPITGFSWLIVYKNSPNAVQLKRFLTWCVTKGQSFCAPLDYAPVPKAVVARELALIKSIQ